jgi:hypothetical protein
MKSKIPKTLTVKEKLESGNKYLPVPLVPGEKVIVVAEVDDKYVKIKHGPAYKTISVFNKHHFESAL